MTALSRLEVSAPGSLMITGEHAVVYGHPSIVCAIDQRVNVSFSKRSDRHVRVETEIAEPIELPIADARAEGPLRFVLGAVERYSKQLEFGLDISIRSDIDPTLGLGSSAAISVAMLCGLQTLVDDKPILDAVEMQRRVSLSKLRSEALALVRKIQGRGSGADLAASAYGGMIEYQLAKPEGIDARVSHLPDPPPMSLCYCGYKTPTSVVLEKIAKDMIGREDEFKERYKYMGVFAGVAAEAAKDENWSVFHTTISSYQRQMELLGVSDDKLDQLIGQALQHSGVESAKISGSGLGDCIIAFGECPDHHTLVELAKDGVRIEAID